MKIVYGIIGIIFWIIEALLGLRFLLNIFGANTGSDFVRWIFNASQPFLAPFAGIFPTIDINGRFLVEFSTLFAIIIYALIYYLIIWILDYLLPPMPPEDRHGMTDEEIEARRVERRRRYGPRL